MEALAVKSEVCRKPIVVEIDEGKGQGTSFREVVAGRTTAVIDLGGDDGKGNSSGGANAATNAGREAVAGGSKPVRKKSQPVRHKRSTRAKLVLANLGESSFFTNCVPGQSSP